MARPKSTIKVQLADKQAELAESAEAAREQADFHRVEASRLASEATATDKQREAVEQAYAILDAAGVTF